MADQDVITPSEPTGELPAVRSIGPADLEDALVKGLDDFWAMPTHVVFLSLIYPVVGLALGRATFGYDIVPLLFPLAAGFALIGPFAAIGLYELSRRRELGLDTLRHLACRRARDLRRKFRLSRAHLADHVRPQGPHHAGRPQPHYRRQRRRLLVRRAGILA